MKVRSLKKIIFEELEDQEGGTGGTGGTPPPPPQEDRVDNNPRLPPMRNLNMINNGTLQRTMVNQQNPQQKEDPAEYLTALRTDHFPANRTIALQAVAYVIPFLLTAALPLIRLVVYTLDSSYNDVILAKTQIFVQPLQGFFNFVIFFGFKVYHQSHLNPTFTLWHIIGKIMFHSTEDPIFISRITIIDEEGGNVRVRVEDEELLSIDNASLGNMNNIEDAFSVSSGVGISFPSPHNSEAQRVSSNQVMNNSDISGLSGFNLDSSGLSTTGKDYSGSQIYEYSNEESYDNCTSRASTVKK